MIRIALQGAYVCYARRYSPPGRVDQDHILWSVTGLQKGCAPRRGLAAQRHDGRFQCRNIRHAGVVDVYRVRHHRVDLWARHAGTMPRSPCRRAKLRVDASGVQRLLPSQELDSGLVLDELLGNHLHLQRAMHAVPAVNCRGATVRGRRGWLLTTRATTRP